MKEKKAKRLSGFGKGYLIYIIALAVIFLAALAVLWSYLAKYQAQKDAEAAALAEKEAQAAYELSVQRAPQLAFQAFLADSTADYWAQQWLSANPGSFDDPAQVTEKMNELFFGDGFAAWKDESYTDTAPVYLLQNGDADLAAVTLSGSELDWSVSTVKMLYPGTQEASMEVPEGCTVYCNGTALDAKKYARDDVSYFEMEDYKDSLVNPVLWTTYTVTGQLFAPTLTVEAPANRTLYTAEDGSCSYILSAQDAQPYQQKAEEFVKKLLYYYMMGGDSTSNHMYDALSYVVHGSQAWKLISDSYNGVTWDTPYPNATFDDVHAGDVTIWADNCMSLDVKYHSEGSAQGYTNVADGTYRLYFIDSGDGNGFGICGLVYN